MTNPIQDVLDAFKRTMHLHDEPLANGLPSLNEQLHGEAIAAHFNGLRHNPIGVPNEHSPDL